MRIEKIISGTPDIQRLWEENMKEPWGDYDKATKFIQKTPEGKIIGGFAVYWDNSDGVLGNFISGWSSRKNLKSVIGVIQHLAKKLGEIYIKTDKRQMKIIAGRLGTLVKDTGLFCYYKIK
jgi:hypothetical protein